MKGLALIGLALLLTACASPQPAPTPHAGRTDDQYREWCRGVGGTVWYTRTEWDAGGGWIVYAECRR